MEAATTLTPEEQRKKRQSVGLPAAPAAITDGMPTAPNPRPKTILIGGIPHLDLGDQQKYPGPISMAANAVAGTIGYIANAPFDRSSQLDANRSGLDSSAEVAAEQQRQAVAKPQTATAAANLTTAPMGIASMTPDQRFKAADAYGNAVDKATGVSSSGAQGIAGLTQRFNTYAKNPEVLAMRNAREELLGSDIQFETGPDGRLRITNTGSQPQVTAITAQAPGQVSGQTASQQQPQLGMLPAAQGTPMDMKGVNAIMAGENRTRGDMIDSMIKANGGNGVAILPDTQGKADAEWNARIDSRGIVSDLQSAMRGAGTRTERAAIGQALSQALAGQNQLATETLRGQNQQVSEHGRNAVTMRGQDIAATNDANKLALDQRRLSIDAPYRQAQTAGQELTNLSAAAMAELQQRVRAGDPTAIETLRALNGKDRVTAHVVGGGQNELGQTLPQTLAVTGADGRVTFHSPNQQPTGKGQAPAAAIEHLRKHPELAESFKSYYGYLPAGF